MSQRSVPAPFLTKTYQLVDDRSTDDVVSWNENGTTFIVWKTDDFSKNLLPTYFKHNNFSSFVRQLNTYGFRKIVPDKWEFSNDNFNRGQKELLTKIHRRKSAATSPSPIPDAVGQTFPVNSSEDLGPGSTSTSSSRDSRNPGSVEASNVAKLGVISEENKKLKIENQKLSSELAQTKNQCDGLIGFLTKYVKVGSDQINHIVSQGSFKSSPDDDVDVDADGSVGEKGRKSVNNECDDGENGECLKLFGVWMKERKKKRSGEEMMDFGGAHRKETKKAAKFGAPWMKVGSYPGDSSKVCN